MPDNIKQEFYIRSTRNPDCGHGFFITEVAECEAGHDVPTKWGEVIKENRSGIVKCCICDPSDEMRWVETKCEHVAVAKIFFRQGQPGPRIYTRDEDDKMGYWDGGKVVTLSDMKKYL